MRRAPRSPPLPPRLATPRPHRSPAQEDWGDVVTEKRIVREAREKVQAERAGKTLDTIHDEGASRALLAAAALPLIAHAARAHPAAALAHCRAGLEDSVTEAEYDRATARKRNMDDWKDGHVKGAGNPKRV